MAVGHQLLVGGLRRVGSLSERQVLLSGSGAIGNLPGEADSSPRIDICYPETMGNLSDFYCDLNDPDLIEGMEKPPRLFHYTDGNGLLGIVRSGISLHATAHSFLNDSGEIRFGTKVAGEALFAMRAELGTEVFEKTTDSLTRFESATLYVACFSESENVLSQWRAYADDGSGYCLGLDLEERSSHEQLNDDYKVSHLLKCCYGELAFHTTLTKKLRHKIQWAATLPAEKRTEVLAQEVNWLIQRNVAAAKHEHFQDEKEWRIVISASSPFLEFKATSLGLVPYTLTDPLVLREVWVGPGPARRGACSGTAVEAFLEKEKTAAQVRLWETSYGPRA